MSKLIAATRIVLVQPTLPDNVGAVARAMRHFGLSDLVIAEGGISPTHPSAVRLAAGADAILSDARAVDTLDEALDGVVFAVGTTARPYEAADLRTREPREVATLARDYAEAGSVALVFGTERHGLLKETLKRFHQIARIPGEPEACLNLAMAVNVFAYEWYLASEHGPREEKPLLAAAASEASLDDLGRHLTDALKRLGVFRAHDAASKAHTLRRLLSRTRLDADEEALVRAVVRKLPSILGG
ncbi:MAG TPA: TrmH family RNA methyltransferase [Pantanalinema sp.]